MATYVATFSSDDDVGAADVDVQVGQAPDGAWYVRTRDDAGGDDDAPDTAYPTEAAATAAAERLARCRDEGDGEDAAGYRDARVDRAAEEAAEEADAAGEWAVYWETALDDRGPRARYRTRDAAEAVVAQQNRDLRRANPGSHLLCGFAVRRLVDGEWESVD